MAISKRPSAGKKRNEFNFETSCYGYRAEPGHPQTNLTEAG
jgi:hypothetical protein